jgi:hypothetical protein
VKVQINGATTTTSSDTTAAAGAGGSDDGGLPSWAWALIGVGAVGALVAAFAAGRHGKQPGEGPPPAPGAPPPPGTPG